MEKNKDSSIDNLPEGHRGNLDAIITLGKKLQERFSVEGVMESSIEEIMKILAPDRIFFYMRNKGKLELMESSPGEFQDATDTTHAHGDEFCLCRLAADTRDPVFSTSLAEEPKCTCGQCRRSPYVSLAALPLQARKKNLGVLAIASLSRRNFKSRKIFLEAIAHQISVSMNNVLTLRKAKAQITQLESRYDRLLRKKAPEKITKNKSQDPMKMLQVFFDGTPDAMMLLDGKMRVKMMNLAARKYFRIDPDLAPGGKTCHQLFWNRATPCGGCNLAANLQTTQPMVFERKCVVKPDCTEKVSIFPIQATGRNARQFIVHISDISKEKNIERQLQQADKMISLGVLVSGVAHEINNPNNWTMMNAPILAEAWKSILPILDAYYEQNGDFNAGGLPYPEMRNAVPQLLDGILDGSKRIMRIVEELKNYSRQEPDKNKTSVDINQSLKIAVSLVSKQLEKSTDNFSVSYGENIPPVFGNSQKIEQVVVNLLLNACQALPDRIRGISLRSFFDDHSDKVVISVRDEGLGIPENVIPRIMDPFFTTKRHMGGTGLGLSVSTKIVQDLGGQLTVKSKPGKGATFTVQLPTEHLVEKKKVLVADDDEVVRAFIARSLGRTHHFFVREAATGIEACLMLGMDPPDVLILDINMPDMDGLEVCRQIQKTPTLADLKVVIISGDCQSDKARAMSEMGFKNILAKPLSVEGITRVVEAVARGEQISLEAEPVPSEPSKG